MHRHLWSSHELMSGVQMPLAQHRAGVQNADTHSYSCSRAQHVGTVNAAVALVFSHGHSQSSCEARVRSMSVYKVSVILGLEVGSNPQ